MASSFSEVMAAKLGTVGEYVFLWNKLLLLEALDSFCEAVGWQGAVTPVHSIEKPATGVKVFDL